MSKPVSPQDPSALEAQRPRGSHYWAAAGVLEIIALIVGTGLIAFGCDPTTSIESVAIADTICCFILGLVFAYKKRRFNQACNASGPPPPAPAKPPKTNIQVYIKWRQGLERGEGLGHPPPGANKAEKSPLASKPPEKKPTEESLEEFLEKWEALDKAIKEGSPLPDWPSPPEPPLNYWSKAHA